MPSKYKVIQKTFKSFDDTEIGYQVVGNGSEVIFLFNGLGGNITAWMPLINAFGENYKFVTWDYRGLFKSKPPKDIKKLRIEDHVRDAEILIEKEKIKKARVVGWSMGVQVALEYYRDHASFYESMVLMNGTYGFPFDTALNSPILKYILPTVNDLAKKIAPKIQPTIMPIAHKVMDSEAFMELVIKLGLVHANLDRAVFKDVAKDMVTCDLLMYHEILTHLSEHDASNVLPKVKVPVLVIGGGEDRLTPVVTAEKMAHKISTSELLIIPNGTHYSILEFPDIINLRVKQFWDEKR
ncbi:alpha/beta hydrolase [bacterium]|nr:alpha/beta hydrolase [bacterium]